MNPSKAENDAVKKLNSLLKSSDIDATATNNIQLEIWRKYILNCAYNVATARHLTTIGPLRDSPEKAADYEALVREAALVGRTLGVPITDEHISNVIYRFYNEHPYNAGSSLQRDIMQNKQSEYEVFSGYIVKTAKKLGLSVPVSEEYYNTLIQMCNIAK